MVTSFFDSLFPWYFLWNSSSIIGDEYDPTVKPWTLEVIGYFGVFAIKNVWEIL
jgi:hypothetical protein